MPESTDSTTLTTKIGNRLQQLRMRRNAADVERMKLEENIEGAQARVRALKEALDGFDGAILEATQILKLAEAEETPEAPAAEAEAAPDTDVQEEPAPEVEPEQTQAAPAGRPPRRGGRRK